MARTRTETDSMGPIEVPADRYWGAQTQRSIEHFDWGGERVPSEVVRALALVKRAAARTNHELGLLDAERKEFISAAADEVASGRLDAHFPVRVWTSGSGTHANMNVNEVIANLASEMAGRPLGSKEPAHPNDHVNMGQSTNDVFPTAMHLAAADVLRGRLLPAVREMRLDLEAKAEAWADVVKIGRTHLQDAVPMTLGQEFSGYAALLEAAEARLEAVLPGLCRLPLGGTAVGTGLNAAPGFAEKVVERLAKATDLPLAVAPNRYALMGSHDDLVAAAAAVKGLAVSLSKIANDVRLLSCGPRAGLGELVLPANEPGSSIMPGKVNPTQCEAMAMASAQVVGLEAAVAWAGAAGQLELNACKPLIIHNVLAMARLLADACGGFTRHLLQGLAPDRARIDEFLNRSLMLVTALSPKIGYDKAAAIAHKAHVEGTTLREAALALGHVTAEEFDAWVDPYAMARPTQREEGQ